jgi:hypothetical protein
MYTIRNFPLEGHFVFRVSFQDKFLFLFLSRSILQLTNDDSCVVFFGICFSILPDMCR